ncbi:MAG: anhydro-N-acetylmuramic acid kinase [Prevotellaceae bacterium]|jgi:anhydro-N-acetylmuramic acid kinase|nr:anhydro-N-acetylmuramic acid kinase [Prevotellaceae bacterium]
MVTPSLFHPITAVGVMSGTSLDGLDVCLCNFGIQHSTWQYTILAAETFPYDVEMKEQLSSAHRLDALQLLTFHAEYGKYIGKTVKQFIDRHGVIPLLIASHGHTVFHQPAQGVTFQTGSGAAIAAETDINTVCDFRTTDVAHGGQGAPLVPIGDQLLFPDYDYCLNLGGFANISYEQEGRRIAYDICPVNYVLNHYIRAVGLDYDAEGVMAAGGSVHEDLLDALNSLDFYTQQGPKSMGREWVEREIFPAMEQYSIPLADKLRTYCEHAAVQIGRTIGNGRVLVTGGGTFNKFLLNRIAAHTKGFLHVPETLLIHYKEALIFALLGTLYFTNQVNCLASVTGAQADSIGGALYKVNN